MNTRAIRKALVVFCVDIIIIIGIFVLQFRTDSTIIEKIGNLQVTLEKQENSDNLNALQNKLEVKYNGLSFYSDDQNSAKIIVSGKSKEQNIRLVSYEKHDNRGFTFNFTDNVSITFDISSLEETSSLSILASLPYEVESLCLPYNFNYNMKVQKDDGNRVVLSGKNATWAFTTSKINNGYVYFSPLDTSAHYAIFDDTKKFSFDSLTELAISDESVYSTTIAAFKGNLITSYKSAIISNKISELSTIAYVAAMAETGKYQQAIDEIPSSFKKSENRTYLSAPYFNNLAKLNSTIDTELKEEERYITQACQTHTLSIYTRENIAAYLCMYPNTESVTDLLSSTANEDLQTASIAQVTGIINTYNELQTYKTEYASLLYPAVEKCINRITNACIFENDTLTMSENDQFLSVVQAVTTGAAIMRYGELSGQQTYVKAGRVIINSYLQESTSFDLRTLSTLYPVLSYNNWYYPHYKFINNDSSDLIWAWTCAKDITYKKDKETGLSLYIDFPEGDIHHIIFKGIPKFNAIYIYNIAYRTDPRFETYNSSGYIYKDDGYTLLLKSRHKSKVETVRMSYPDGVAPRKIINKIEDASYNPVKRAEEQKNVSTENTTNSTKDNTSTKPVATTNTSSNYEEENTTTTAITSTTNNTAKKRYSVYLEESPSNKKKNIVAVICSVQPDYSETQAAELFDSAPAKIKSGLSSADADEVISRIMAAGGRASKRRE